MTQQLSIMRKGLHIHVCWLMLVVDQDLSSHCQAEHLYLSSPCCLDFLMAQWLGSKSECPKRQEEEAATWSLTVFY